MYERFITIYQTVIGSDKRNVQALIPILYLFYLRVYGSINKIYITIYGYQTKADISV